MKPEWAPVVVATKAEVDFRLLFTMCQRANCWFLPYSTWDIWYTLNFKTYKFKFKHVWSGKRKRQLPNVWTSWNPKAVVTNAVWPALGGKSAGALTVALPLSRKTQFECQLHSSVIWFGAYLFTFLFLFPFWYWGLNPGLHACQACALPLVISFLTPTFFISSSIVVS